MQNQRKSIKNNFLNFFGFEKYKQNKASEVDHTINKIIAGIKLNETVVFCGAGISRDSGLPVVNQIVPYILEKLKVPEEDLENILNQENSTKIPFEAFMEVLQENSTMERIFDIYGQGEPNTNHILLANLIKEEKLKTIITTNFDNLIENALLMGPKILKANIDYDVIYKEEDFEKINWSDGRIRIIKIHGSVEDQERMVITLKQVANKVLSKARMSVIENVFSNGNHRNVLILGYSSSDIFDLTLHIQSIREKFKDVYYIQHSDFPKVEDIQDQFEKNPFKKFTNSKRLYYNTNQFVKKLWESIIDSSLSYELKTGTTNWKINVDEWNAQVIKEKSESIRFIFPANIYMQMGMFQNAIKYNEQALKIARELSQLQHEGNCLDNIGSAYSMLGKYSKAIDYTKQALKIVKQIGDKHGEGIYLGNLGNNYLNIGEYPKAIEYLEQALNLLKEHDGRLNNGKFLANLGIAYLNKGEYPTSIQHLEKALIISQEIGNKRGESANLSNLGNVYRTIGENTKAKAYFEQALMISQEISDEHGKGRDLGNLGIVFLNLGEYPTAIKNSKQALNILQELGDKQGVAGILNNIGNVNFVLQDYKKSILNYEQAYEISKEIGDKLNEGINLSSIGNVYLVLDDYQNAKAYFEEGLKISIEIGDKNTEGGLYSNLGIIYCNLMDNRKAIEYFEKALNIIKPLFGSNHPKAKELENSLRIEKSKIT
jgi:tetratricopeptide (TPR) repeat protein